MNYQSMLKQVQKMQREVEEKQESINKKLFPGKYQFVEVTLNGKKEIVSVSIDKESIDKDDIEMLEDFIILAHKDALGKVDAEYEKEMAPYESMLNGLM